MIPAMPVPAYEDLRFQSLLAGLLDPVVTIDDHGEILFASDSVRGVFGYSPHELLGQNVRMLMPEPHRSKHDDYLARYRETGETWILNTIREFQAQRKNGQTFWVELSVARIDIPGRTQPLFTGSFRDITQRKQFERALRDSEARFRAIFDGEIELVGLLDPSGRVLEMNRAALASVGLERIDVVDLPFWETPWWRERKEDCERWVKRAAQGETIREELELDTQRGRIFVDFSLRPIRDVKGEIILLLPEGRDVTALKRAQARERQMMAALAALGEQASVLAHEIKNPITSIHLALRAVADKLGEGQAEVLEELIERMRKLEGKLRRTLSFARPIDLDAKPTPILPLVLGPVDTLRDEAEDRSVDLRFDVDANLGSISVDAGRIEDVITNLVRNALDVLPEGGTIAVSARAEGNGVSIRVEDDGPGLPDMPAEELFKPFVTTKEKGTGIGLALARKVAQAHGGSLDAGPSQLGGACFELRLPGPRT